MKNMKKQLTHLLLGAFIVLMSACQNNVCYDLVGRWGNQEGQSIIFDAGGKALWLIRFGSQIDTFTISYFYDCQKSPAELNLSNFKSGPYSGKTLFGILDWKDQNSFRLDAEAGESADIRPKNFGSEQTQVFVKE
jgi:hypothetical protein